MNPHSTAHRRCARRVLLATALGILLLGSAAHAQEPLTAKIFFKNLPPGPVPTFDLAGTSKIDIVIQVTNPGSTPVMATKGTFAADFWRRLFVTDPLGGLGTFTGPLVHPDTQLYFCHSRQGVLQRPTAIPVAPLEVIPAGATVEWEVADLRKLYSVPQIGRYVVQLRSPVITVVPSSSAAVITDCDQGPGQTFIDLSVDTSPSRHHFTLESNQLEFFVGSAYAFVGFLSPVPNDSACPNPTITPCVTAQKNSTVVLKFQLFNGSTPVTNAIATVSAIQISGTPPLQPPDNLGRGPRADNQYKYDPGANQYVFTLNTSVLSVGVWRLDTTISDGSVHSVHIAVR
jgi:hypothetical protein